MTSELQELYNNAITTYPRFNNIVTRLIHLLIDDQYIQTLVTQNQVIKKNADFFTIETFKQILENLLILNTGSEDTQKLQKELITLNATYTSQAIYDYSICTEYNKIKNPDVQNVLKKTETIITELNKLIDNVDKLYYIRDLYLFFSQSNTIREGLSLRLKKRYEKFKDDTILGTLITKYNDALKLKQTPNIKNTPNTDECVLNITCKKYEALDLYKSKMISLYEEILGAVRVYVRINSRYDKPEQPISYITDNDYKNINKIQNHDLSTPLKSYEFTGVFDFTFKTNKALLEGPPTSKPKIDDISIKPMFELLKLGTNVVFFGYGYSGSGKTYTLLGNSDVPGLLQEGLQSITDIESITVSNVFELYKHTVNLSGNIGVKDIIINLHGILDIPDMTKPKQEQEQKCKDINPIINITKIQTDITRLLSDITLCRINLGSKRIKPTINNPESSRSHLFIIFKIKFNDGKEANLTIVDMAGMEDPNNIYNDIFNTNAYSMNSILTAYSKLPTDIITYANHFNHEYINKIVTDKKLFDKYNKDQQLLLTQFNNICIFNNNNNKIPDKPISKTKGQLTPNKIEMTKQYELLYKNLTFKTFVESLLKDNIDILKEGFCINESLNHLEYFFRAKLDTNIYRQYCSFYYKTGTYTYFAGNGQCLDIPDISFIQDEKNRKNRENYKSNWAQNKFNYDKSMVFRHPSLPMLLQKTEPQLVVPTKKTNYTKCEQKLVDYNIMLPQIKFATNQIKLSDTVKPEHSKCHMIPILNYLDTLGSTEAMPKTTKFVMIACIRSDKEVEADTTIEFANAISPYYVPETSKP